MGFGFNLGGVILVSKNFAMFFSVVVLFIAAAVVGVFFLWVRLRAENATAAMNQRLEQEWLNRHVHLGVGTDSRAQFFALAAETVGAVDLHHIGRYTPVFSHMGDVAPIDVVSLHIVQVLNRHNNWKQIRTLAGEKWIDMDWIPEEILLEVPSFDQQALGLPTGCEIVAVAMLINKYTEVDVLHLVNEMPRSYDPLLGFRGDPFTRNGFTILPPALMEITERYLGSAIDKTGATIEDIQAHLALERPVVVWVRGMFGFNVHAITLTGFNQSGFFYNDPWLGGKNEFITYQNFLAMWEDPIRDFRLNRVYPVRMALGH